jgi:hypothetical protein
LIEPIELVIFKVREQGDGAILSAQVPPPFTLTLDDTAMKALIVCTPLPLLGATALLIELKRAQGERVL